MRYKELDVYKCSIKFLALAWQLTKEFPRGNAELVDQLKRASLSVPLNIGEGAGRRTRADSAKHYSISRGSAMECSAVLDVLEVLEFGDQQRIREGQQLLHRIVSMLSKMCVK
ncbi:MAG: four helix bundle protein [Oligoflexus sp.]